MNSELFNYSLKTLQVLNVVADLVLSVALFALGTAFLTCLSGGLHDKIITRLINSIKRRTSSARELGYDVLFVALDDLDVLADSLETALRAKRRPGRSHRAAAGHV
ncbi:hypothetical protein [Klebsiella pneumoniae]|uniref:hypothetical protein n=1 Tax=Klebsiella pneumoniae TaxID=573 RepID=UPI0012FD17C5|nr:hypothetical protein [Klebsiella pneumoniae]